MLYLTFYPVRSSSSNRAAQTLEKSFFFQFPGVGRAASVSHPCPEAITVAFVWDPTREPDASCVAEMERLGLVTDLHVNSGVYRFSKALLSDALWSSVAALIRRLMGRARQEKLGGAGARWLTTSAFALALVFLLGLAATLVITAGDNPLILAFGVPGWAAPLFLVPILVALSTLAALLLTAVAWRSAGWSPWRRLLHSVAILGCVGFLTLLFRFGIF